MKRPEDSLAAVERALAIRPQWSGAWEEKGRALAALERTDEAAEALLVALRIDPLSIDDGLHGMVVADLVDIARGWWDERPAEALAWFALALRLDPHGREARALRIKLLRAEGVTPEARAAALARVEREPHSFDAHRDADDLLTIAGEREALVAMWTRYVERHPDDRWGFAERAGVRSDAGDRSGFREDSRRACELGLRPACAAAR